jgi:hypothetical protein
VSRALLAVNQFLIRISRGLFSYQIFMRAKPLPLLKSLLEISQEQSSIRAAMLETAGSGDPGALSLR